MENFRRNIEIPLEIQRVNDALLKSRRSLQERVENQFSNGFVLPCGVTTSSELCRATDLWLSELWRIAAANIPFPTRLVAVGGYGYGRLAFWSDIDVVIHIPEGCENSTELLDAVKKWMDWTRATKLKVAHAVRHPQMFEDALVEDPRTAISYLDVREICTTNVDGEGESQLATSTDLYSAARDFLRGDDGGITLISNLWTGILQRHERLGETVYLLEPDVKNGKGGQRDLQILRWAALVKFDFEPGFVTNFDAAWHTEQRDSFNRFLNWIWEVRQHLHAFAKRKSDRLRFLAQRHLAATLLRRMDLPVPDHSRDEVEAFLQLHFKYTRSAARLVEIYLRLWGDCDKNDSFMNQFTRDAVSINDWTPEQVERILRSASESGALLNPKLEQELEEGVRGWNGAQVARGGEVVRRLLTDPKLSRVTSRRLLGTGMLTRVIPEFSPIVSHVQHDVYHVYTTDEHLLKCHDSAIELMRYRKLVRESNDRIESEKIDGDTSRLLEEEISEFRESEGYRRWRFFYEVATEIEDVETFLLAVLFHDIGKNRGGGHSRKGAEMMEQVGPRIGLTDEQTELLSFLVREHLILSDGARRRDISDRRLLRNLVGRIRTVETLNMLICLTFCDMLNVGEHVLTDWNASLLIEFYRHLKDGLISGFSTMWLSKKDAVDAKINLLAAAISEKKDLTLENAKRSLDEFLREISTDHLLDCNEETLLRQLEVYKEAHQGEKIVVVATPTEETATTELIVWAEDQPGILAKITGVVTSLGLTILTAQITTTNKMHTLDTFRVAEAAGAAHALARGEQRALTDLRRIEKLKQRLEKVLSGEEDVESLLAERIEQKRLDSKEIPEVDAVVKVVPDISDDFVVIEVRAPDRIGLLYELSSSLEPFSVNIHMTKIDSLGTQVIDTFFIESTKKKELELHEIEAICAALKGVAQESRLKPHF